MEVFERLLKFIMSSSIQTKRAKQLRYQLRQLRKYGVSSEILKSFYSGAVKSILTQNISSWFGNSCVEDPKALQRFICVGD